MKEQLKKKIEAEEDIQDVKETYESPDYQSYKPLKIMKDWVDKSSELEF